MNIDLTASAELDLSDGYWFYERQSTGLGDYFRTCLFADIESLVFYAGIHSKEHGYHRSLSKKFPFGIYYAFEADRVLVVAVLDLRSEPQWIRSRLA